MKLDRKTWITGAAALIIGLGLGWIMFGGSSSGNNEHTEVTADSHKDETIWTCSMHPQIRMDKPGKCPICGMDLIPLEEQQQQEEESSPDEITLTPSAIALANIETVTVKRGIPEKTVYLLGTVKPDERNIAELTARFGGRIEKLYINFTGQDVKKGEKLATIYSPELIAAQRELLEAAKYKNTNPSFYKSARTKLKLWDLTDQQIDDLENSGKTQHYFDLLSPITGTVTKRDVAIGDYVKVGSPMFEVIDLNKVWVMFDAYEKDLPWIQKGDEINFTIQSLPGKTFKAKVKYIDPFLDPKTRVAKVRVELNNPKKLLKPEMYAAGILKSKMKKTNDLLIPKSAILWTGKRAVVYVKVPNRKQPTFVYREVTLGPEAGNFYVVLSGLKEGEVIAMNGVFNIDAAAQLAGKPSMMNPEGGKVNTMPGMDMGGRTDDVKSQKSGKKKPSKPEVPMDFKIQLGKVVDSYLQLKDAFVKSDGKSIEEAAQKTLDALDNVDMTLLKGDAHIQWMKIEKPLKENLKGIIQMKGLEMKRSHFSIVSDNIAKAIEMFGISGSKTSSLYLEFCPMAFDNKGAYWVSESKEIRNPYFGDAMLTCGSVKKEF